VLDHLRSHPIGASLERLEKRLSRNMFRHAEVSKFHHSIGVHKNIGSLDIPMNSMLIMQVGESREDLTSIIPDNGLFESPILLEKLVNRPS
jgi:hypothetical protein